MPRKKDVVPSVRLRLGDLNIKLGVDPKVDALYYELLALKKQRRAGNVILNRLLTGQILESSVEPSLVEKARADALEILNTFMLDDE